MLGLIVAVRRLLRDICRSMVSGSKSGRGNICQRMDARSGGIATPFPAAAECGCNYFLGCVSCLQVCAMGVSLLQGEEAVLVSMKKAIDICVYYTLGREAQVSARIYPVTADRAILCRHHAISQLRNAAYAILPGATAGVQGSNLGNLSTSTRYERQQPETNC